MGSKVQKAAAQTPSGKEKSDVALTVSQQTQEKELQYLNGSIEQGISSIGLQDLDVIVYRFGCLAMGIGLQQALVFSQKWATG